MFQLIFLLSTITYIVSGQHAKCYMKLTVSSSTSTSLTVAALNNSLVKMVQTRTGYNATSCVYADQQAEFCGYSVISISTKDDHFQHETPVHHYVDDINFSAWTQSSTLKVEVQADSESEPNSIGDYDTNFCNIFNLFRNGNAHQLNYELAIEYTECTNAHHPDTSNGWSAAYTQCDTY